MLKKNICLALLSTVLMLFSGCGIGMTVPEYAGADLHIVTTVFPPYDFARNVTLGAEHVYVQQLLRPGMESHTFDPTPADILAVRNCDVFIYTGGESDAWVETLLDAADNTDVQIIRMMDCTETVEESVVDGMTHHHHDHEDDHDSDHVEYDEHVWTDPHNAMRITEAIAATLCEVDPGSAEHYRTNTDAYCAQLQSLDATLHEIAETAAHHTLIFGDRFPFRYLCDAYGISYRAAFPGCAAESEPSAATMIALIETVKDEQIPAILTIEMSNGKIARAIAEETGADIAELHSCHNRSADEAMRDETYLTLMYKNAAVLSSALNGPRT